MIDNPFDDSQNAEFQDKLDQVVEELHVPTQRDRYICPSNLASGCGATIGVLIFLLFFIFIILQLIFSFIR